MEFDKPAIESTSNSTFYKWKVLITIMLGTVMGSMDFSMVNLAFPKLTQVFHTGIDVVVWVTLAFTLANTSLLLIVGKIGDLIGRKRLYITGQIIFTCGIIACSFAGSIGQLIVFRIFHGIGASMVFSAGPAFVVDAFPNRDTGKGLGILNAAISAGFIIGPVAGGLLLNYMDWRSIFYTRIPVGILATIMSVLFLKPDQGQSKKIRFDFAGMLISILGFFLLVFGVNQISRLGITNPVTLALIGAGLLLLVVFVGVERRAIDPILDFSLFKNSIFTFFGTALFIYFIAVPVFILIMPFFFIDGIGLNPSQSGLLLAIASVVSIAVGPLSGMLSDRFGEVWFAALGVAISIVGYNFIRTFNPSMTVFVLIPILAMLGTGAGMFQTPNNSAIFKTVQRDRLGTVSALIGILRGVGMAVGMALIGTVYAARKAYHFEQLHNPVSQAIDVKRMTVFSATQDTLLVSMAIFVIVILLIITPRVFLKHR